METFNTHQEFKNVDPNRPFNPSPGDIFDLEYESFTDRYMYISESVVLELYRIKDNKMTPFQGYATDSGYNLSLEEILESISEDEAKYRLHSTFSPHQSSNSYLIQKYEDFGDVYSLNFAEDLRNAAASL